MKKLGVWLLHRLMERMYPDFNMRAVAYAAEAGELFSIIHFQRGEVVEAIVIEADDADGFYVGVRLKELVKNE